MHAYLKAIKQLREQGYVSVDVKVLLTNADLQKAIEEASKPA